MPRNGSSVYSLPAGNPVVPGTVIATTWANTTLTDIATALTNSLSTDGSTASVSLSGKTMTGGTFSAPTVTGLLTLMGGQIGFPAVQVPSAGANVLDDYEEGTWTPVLTYVTPGNLIVSYTTQVGRYTKIGNQTCMWVSILTSTFTHTTATGNMQITGWPSAVGVPACNIVGATRSDGFTSSGVSPMVAVMDASGSTVSFTVWRSSDNLAFAVNQGNHSTGTNINLAFNLVFSG